MPELAKITLVAPLFGETVCHMVWMQIINDAWRIKTILPLQDCGEVTRTTGLVSCLRSRFHSTRVVAVFVNHLPLVTGKSHAVYRRHPIIGSRPSGQSFRLAFSLVVVPPGMGVRFGMELSRT